MPKEICAACGKAFDGDARAYFCPECKNQENTETAEVAE